MALNGRVYLVQVVESVMSVPKSLEQAVHTPPTESVLRSGTLTRTALSAVDEPFFAQNVMLLYLEAL